MKHDDGGYDLKPQEPASSGSPAEGPGAPPPAPRPGEPGWVPPVPIIEKADPAEESPADPDVKTHKGIAALGYLLFLIPLVAAPNSKFARYHANQALLLFILFITAMVGVVGMQVGLMLVDRFLTSVQILAWFFSCAFHLLQVALLVGWLALGVVGVIQALNGLFKPLPIVGHWSLIK